MRVSEGMRAGLRQIPPLIALLFAADVALALIPVIDFALGHPFPRLSNLFNLDTESTVPTWYSSMQWFCAGAMFALFAFHAWRSRMRGALSIVVLALACLTFSLDEIAEIHERLGFAADALMSHGSREGTALWSTGLWPFVIGIPAIALMAVAVRGTRHVFLARAPRALVLVIVGFVVMFAGALAVELVANLLPATAPHGGLFLAQVVTEEFLEMLGVTLIAWSASSLLTAYGFELRLPAAAPERHADITVRPAAAACASVRSAGN
jgi:hypothetical protein